MKYKNQLIYIIEQVLNYRDDKQLDIDEFFMEIHEKHGSAIFESDDYLGVLYTFLDFIIDAKNHSFKNLSINPYYSYESGINDLNTVLMI